MADKLASAAPKKPRKKAKTTEPARTTAASNGQGHNSLPNTKTLEEMEKRIFSLEDQAAESAAEFRSDISNVLEEYATKTGCSKSALRMFHNKAKAEKAFARRMADLDGSKKDDFDRLMAAATSFGTDTPMGAYARMQAGLVTNEEARAG